MTKRDPDRDATGGERPREKTTGNRDPDAALGPGELEALFAAARHAPRGDPAPPDLLARVLADAEALQPAAPAARSRPAGPSPVAASRLRVLLGTLGGWPALGGLACAGVAGVAIGLALPGVHGWPAPGATAAAEIALAPAAAYDLGYLLTEEAP